MTSSLGIGPCVIAAAKVTEVVAAAATAESAPALTNSRREVELWAMIGPSERIARVALSSVSQSPLDACAMSSLANSGVAVASQPRCR